jgi:hypothetical protein
MEQHPAGMYTFHTRAALALKCTYKTHVGGQQSTT